MHARKELTVLPIAVSMPNTNVMRDSRRVRERFK